MFCDKRDRPVMSVFCHDILLTPEFLVFNKKDMFKGGKSSSENSLQTWLSRLSRKVCRHIPSHVMLSKFTNIGTFETIF